MFINVSMNRFVYNALARGRRVGVRALYMNG